MSFVAAPIAAEPQPAPAQIAHAPASFGLTDLGLILMSVIWGVNFSIVKVGLGAIEPLVFGGLRVTIAALVLAVIALSMRSAQWPSRRDLLILAGLGVIGNGFYQLLFLTGMSRTRAGTAALLVASGPAWIAIISRLTGRERLPPRGWMGIGLQMIGVACVVSSANGVDTGGNALLGAGLIAIGSIMWAVYTVALQPYTKTVHPFQLSAITMASGALVCGGLAIPGALHTDWSAVGPAAWGAVLYASIGAMVIAYMLYYNGVRMIGATRTSMYANLQPLIALTFAALMLSERPTAWQLLGALFIMGGLLLSRTAMVRPVVAVPPVAGVVPSSSFPDRS